MQAALLTVQGILRGMGHDEVGEPDGRLNPPTVQALAAEGFPVDGDGATLDVARLKVLAARLEQKRLAYLRMPQLRRPEP